MIVTLRRAATEDADVVAALTRSAYAKWAALTGREPFPMRADHALAIRDHHVDLLFVGVDLAAVIETIVHGAHLLVENVAVAPAHQKRGFGSRLMEHAERMAAEAGMAAVRLCTNARFEENLTLYASLGYQVGREEPLNCGVAVHMAKHLPRPSTHMNGEERRRSAGSGCPDPAPVR